MCFITLFFVFFFPPFSFPFLKSSFKFIPVFQFGQILGKMARIYIHGIRNRVQQVLRLEHRVKLRRTTPPTKQPTLTNFYLMLSPENWHDDIVNIVKTRKYFLGSAFGNLIFWSSIKCHNFGIGFVALSYLGKLNLINS